MLKYALACAAAITLAGCSTATLDDAAKLGSAGSTAWDAASAYAAMNRRDYQTYVARVDLVASFPVPPPPGVKPPPRPMGTPQSDIPACNSFGLTPLSKESQDAAKAYIDLLAKTRSYFSQLSRAYAAFGALASYGAQDNLRTALEGSVTAANGLLTKLNEQTIPANAGALFSTIGGMLAQRAQEHAVLEASAKLRAISETVNANLKKHRRDFVDPRIALANVDWQTQSALWCAGFVDARPLIGSLIADSGLTLTNAPVSPKDPVLHKAVEGLLSARAQQKRDDLDAGFDQITSGLDDVIAQHDKLERDQPVDVGKLAVLVTRLEHLVDLYSGTKDGSQ